MTGALWLSKYLLESVIYVYVFTFHSTYFKRLVSAHFVRLRICYRLGLVQITVARCMLLTSCFSSCTLSCRYCIRLKRPCVDVAASTIHGTGRVRLQEPICANDTHRLLLGHMDPRHHTCSRCSSTWKIDRVRRVRVSKSGTKECEQKSRRKQRGVRT